MLDEATKLSRLLLPRRRPTTSPRIDGSRPWPTCSPSGRAATKTYESDLGRFRIRQYVTVVATVKSATSRPQPRAPRRKMLKVVLTDGRQELDVTFFSAWTPGEGTPAGSARDLCRRDRHVQPALAAHPPGLFGAR